MATGKSSTGRLVARQLHFDFIDTDALIEARLNLRISEIFAQKGEAWFRDYERQLVAELANYRHTVFATGGGLAANPVNMASLKQHALVVCLWASPETVWSRTRSSSNRPLLADSDPLSRIRQLLIARAPYYRQADVLVHAERRSVKKVAQQILHEFRLVYEPDE
jgi:shikimate kinase